jgi:hypothetical protein
VVFYPESALRLAELVGFLASFGAKTLRIQDLIEIAGIQENVQNFWTLRGRAAFEAAKGMQEGLALARRSGMDVFVSQEIEAGIARLVAAGAPTEDPAMPSPAEAPPIALTAPAAETAIKTPSPTHDTVVAPPPMDDSGPMPTLVVVGAGSDNPIVMRRTYAAKPPAGMTRSCSDPWSLVMIHGDGRSQACCFSTVNYGHLGKDGGLDDLRNSPRARKLREGLLNGELDDFCAACNMRALVPVDRFQHTISRYMLKQEYPRAARAMAFVDSAKHHLRDRPYLFYLQNRWRLRHYPIDLPYLFYLRQVKPRLAYITLFKLAVRRKGKHFLVDLPYLIYLRKIKPRFG